MEAIDFNRLSFEIAAVQLVDYKLLVKCTIPG